MPTYNVLIGVVELIDADDTKSAIRQLKTKLEAHGFEVYGDGNPAILPDAFESEPING